MSLGTLDCVLTALWVTMHVTLSHPPPFGTSAGQNLPTLNSLSSASNDRPCSIQRSSLPRSVTPRERSTARPSSCHTNTWLWSAHLRSTHGRGQDKCCSVSQHCTDVCTVPRNVYSAHLKCTQTIFFKVPIASCVSSCVQINMSVDILAAAETVSGMCDQLCVLRPEQ